MSHTLRAIRAWTVLSLVLGVAVFTTGPQAGPGVAFAGDETDKPEKPKKSVEAGCVYVGDCRKWEKPAEVDADRVYAKIDEYKEIVEKGLKPGDPKYELLLSKASRRFVCAVKKCAKDGGYDLVARVGSVKGVDSVPDITSDVIANL